MMMKTGMVVMAVVCVAWSVQGAVVNFSTAEGYKHDAVMNLHEDWATSDGWVAQNRGDVEGAAVADCGDFVRAIYQEGQFNEVGSSITLTATLSFVGNVGERKNKAEAWQEGLFRLGLTEEQDKVGAAQVRCGIEFCLDNENNLFVRSGAGGAVTRIGEARLYDGHTFAITTTVVNKGGGTFKLTGSVDSLDDNVEAFVLSCTVDSKELAAAPLAFGMFSTMPAAGESMYPVHAYNGVNLRQFTMIPKVHTLGFVD